jgi:carbon storage regulator
MFVLKRAVGERIKIGEDVEIVLLHMEGSHATIGIEAPRSVRVKRLARKVAASEWHRAGGRGGDRRGASGG